MPRSKRKVPWLDTRGGIYYVKWYEAATAQTRGLSLRTSDEETAQRRYAAFLIEGADAFDSAPTDRAGLTVEAALNHYWDEHVVESVVDKERIGYAIKNLKPHFGPMLLSEVDIPACRRYAKRRRDGEIGRPARDSTIRKELSHLVAAANHAVRWRRIAATDGPQIELPDAGDPRDRWLTQDELDRLRAAAGHKRTRLFIDLAYHTAARKGAIEKLTLFQVDLEARKINLNPPGRRQTKKRRPVVPIVDALHAVLAPRIKEMKESGESHVLWHPGSIRTGFENAVENAGLADVTPHTLRHTRAVHLAQRGVDLYVIAGLLGDSIQTVYRNYLHHCPDHLRKAIEDAPVAEANEAEED